MEKINNKLQEQSQNKVMTEFVKLFHITPTEIIAHNKSPKISTIRHLYCKLRCENHGASYTATGREISRDHTTVIYAVRRINHLIRLNDKRIVAMWKKVKDIPGYYM